MEFNEAVDFYHSLNRFGVQPGLERIDALCKELGNPQRNLKCVHVAGTNGKGSTCTFIAGVLSAAGYKVGLYTSPYVLEFRERIRLNGNLIPKDDLFTVTEEVKEAISKANEKGIYPTEFEAVTAAAFLYYSRSDCDIVVLETGLGGRFDATNIIEKPAVSVITSISLDHTAILGDTVAKIAWEKAGIIKKSVPVVTSCFQPQSALKVIAESASENSSDLILTGAQIGCEFISGDAGGSNIVADGKVIHIPFAGKHQCENVSLCLAAFKILKREGYIIPDRAVKTGIESAFIPARTEILRQFPFVMLDGSHNESSTAALGEVLKNSCFGKKFLAVMGMMADKDCSAALDNLLPYFSEVIAVTPSNPRAMKAQDFAVLVREKGGFCTVVDDPCEGVKKALEAADKSLVPVVICGSLYLAADVREFIISEINKRKRRFPNVFAE